MQVSKQRERRQYLLPLARLHGRATLVGVDWNDARSGARAFIRKNGWTFPNLRDGDGTVGNDYRLVELFFTDKFENVARQPPRPGAFAIAGGFRG